LRGVGWTLIATGVLILLYVVYLLFFTNLETRAAQQELLDTWQSEIGALDRPATDPPQPDTPPDVSQPRLPAEPVDAAPPDPSPPPVETGDAYAVVWFERDGEPIVHDDPLFVVEGVALSDLRRGPGHYPDSQAPGQPGNLAIAGHRTTYGAPFAALDELVPGDAVHVVDRDGARWLYRVREQRIVAPSALWVVGPDPLDRGGAWLTLTTCHPRFSAAQRLIVFAELEPVP
jgi:sortase A